MGQVVGQEGAPVAAAVVVVDKGGSMLVEATRSSVR